MLVHPNVFAGHGNRRALGIGDGQRLVVVMYPLAEQLEYAAQLYRPGQYDQVAASLSSAPGQFHRRMRSVVYRLLGLGEPARPPFVAPPPSPPALTTWEISADSAATL
ncbi:hypothetical protein [Streptomyces sp. cg40]|uniref:hypothetical protein n=1 Tax=Streptomyces sp. cg40 TaxID=3419764 RepID=UPI003D0241D1